MMGATRLRINSQAETKPNPLKRTQRTSAKGVCRFEI
jgi:hypothetical protein